MLLVVQKSYSMKEYYDIESNELLLRLPGPRCVNKNSILYDTKEAALSEQHGKTHLSRVLAKFGIYQTTEFIHTYNYIYTYIYN